MSSRSKVLVIGPTFLDRYIKCKYPKIDQTAAVPTGQVVSKIERLGGAANVFANLVNMGVPTFLLTVGPLNHTDRVWVRQRNLLDNVASHPHAEWSFAASPRWQPPRKNRLVDEHERLVARYDEELILDDDDEELGRSQTKLLESIWATTDPSVLVLSDYCKGVINWQVAMRAKELARRNKVPIIVDPCPDNVSWYMGTDWVTPNAREAWEMLTRLECDTDEPLHPCKKEHPPASHGVELAKRMDIKNVLVTMGPDGAVLCTNGPFWVYQHERHTVMDTTGAGDTVVAVVAWGVYHQMERCDIAATANRAGGLVVTKAGTATVTLPEVLRLRAAGDPSRKITNVRQAAEFAAVVRENLGRRVTLVNGAFDLLHDGHRHLLRTAYRGGELLVVLVNDDESVRNRKGHPRPIQSLADRMRALSEYEYVDLVVPFSGDAPAAEIKAISPHMVFRGESADPEAELAAIREIGASVIIVPTQYKTSTTEIIRKAHG